MLVLRVLVVVSATAADGYDVLDFWRGLPPRISLYPTLPIAMPSSEAEPCRGDSLALVDNLRNQTVWAMQMWDSSATSPFGVLHGNKYFLGNYDECLLVRSPVRAQYCNVKVRARVPNDASYLGDPFDIDPPPNASVWKKFQDSRRDPSKYGRDESHWGLCVPASCSRREVEKGINLYLSAVNEERRRRNGTTYEAEVPEHYCTDGAEDEFTVGEIAFWAFNVILLAAVVVATWLDVARPREAEPEDRTLRMLMGFSLRRNVRQLVRDGDASHLSFLHGVKVVTIIFIVLDHHVMFRLATAVVNKQDMEEALRSWQNMFIPNGDLLVDTCFFIGGLLVTHLFLEHSDDVKINPILIIASRLFRLAPLYFYVVWFQATALSRFGSGPAWKFGLREEIDYCRKNWWANLLFVQNYVNSDEMCMLHAWYLPCDFHFFVVAILVTMVIKRNKVLGVFLLYFLAVLSVVAPGLITYAYALNPTIQFHPEFLDKPRSDDSFQMLYIKSHTRITVYLLGMITAYHLFANRKSTLKLPKVASVLGCLLALGLLFAPMAYGGAIYYDPRRSYDPIAAAVFASLRRFLWGLAWVVILFVNRFGFIPVFGKVFSWRISVPLSKTTYGVYLIHFILQMSDQAKLKIPYQFIPFDMFVKGANDLFVSVGCAFVLHLVLELPFRLFFKELLFPPRRTAPRDDKPHRPPRPISTIQDEMSRYTAVKL